VHQKSARPEKILATRMKKGPRLTLVWGPWMVNRALAPVCTVDSNYSRHCARYKFKFCTVLCCMVVEGRQNELQEIL